MYFPSVRWFEFDSGIEVRNRGIFIDVPAPIEYIPVHIRGGTIIPTQV